MRLTSIAANISYTGAMSCYVSFTGNGTTISHSCNEAQLAQLAALIEEWKAELLRSSATALFSAFDDMQCIEHKATA